MSDFEEAINHITSEGEEIEALMSEGFRPPPSSSGQSSLDGLPTSDVPDLPLSNLLRKALRSDFPLGPCGVSEEEVVVVVSKYSINQANY